MDGRKRLVAVKFSALGDVAMTLPVLYSVARCHPEVDIYMATRPFFGKMFINPPSNLHVVPMDPGKEYRGVRGIFRIARELHALKPDMAADLHDVMRSWSVTRLLGLGGARTAGLDKGRFTRRDVMRGGRAQRPYISRYFDVFRRLGLDSTIEFTSVFDGGTLPDIPVDIKAPAVGIAPFARYATKTYPPAAMRQVASMLADVGVNVYLFGGRGAEASELASWERDGVVSLAGKFDLPVELAIMSRLAVMVSMDSANQHLAAIAGTRVVTIWGGTTPACGFTAFGSRREDSICMNLSCQPCSIAGTPECPLGHMSCMESISPEVIVDKIIKIVL